MDLMKDLLFCLFQPDNDGGRFRFHGCHKRGILEEIWHACGCTSLSLPETRPMMDNLQTTVTIFMLSTVHSIHRRYQRRCRRQEQVLFPTANQFGDAFNVAVSLFPKEHMYGLSYIFLYKAILTLQFNGDTSKDGAYRKGEPYPKTQMLRCFKGRSVKTLRNTLPLEPPELDT
jgi:hypothetical protein